MVHRQYNISIFPDDLLIVFSKEGRGRDSWKRKSQPVNELIPFFETKLSRSQYSNGTLIYTSTDFDDVTINYDEGSGLIENVVFRFESRQLNTELASIGIDLCNKYKLNMMSEEGILVPPSVHHLNNLLVARKVWSGSKAS